MTTYAIAVRISEAEHDEDRAEYRAQILGGTRTVLHPEEDRDLTIREFAALPLDVQNAYADDEMGDEWDDLWLYPGGEEGLDPDPRWLFTSRDDAESAAAACRIASASRYTVEEVGP